MPNEINKDKNLIQYNNEIESTGVDQKKNRRPLRATGGTIFVWTISGIILAACEGSSRMGLDGVDGENTITFRWDTKSHVPVTSQISDEDIWAYFGKDGLNVIALADIPTEFALDFRGLGD